MQIEIPKQRQFCVSAATLNLNCFSLYGSENISPAQKTLRIKCTLDCKH